MKHKPKPYDAPNVTLLERLRRYNRFTLAELAQRTGVPRATLGRICLGASPDVQVAIKIAACFKVKVEDIWGSVALANMPEPTRRAAKTTVD